MPTRPLDRLMFAQGGLCFFCKEPLSLSEASVEHLVASANGGGNNDENCVACRRPFLVFGMFLLAAAAGLGARLACSRAF